MLFSSLSFLFFFLPLALSGYFLLRTRDSRNLFLLIVSLLFYAWGEPWFVFVMILSIAANWGFGMWVAYIKEREATMWPVLFICCTANLSLLFVYKYLNFLVANLEHLFGITANIPGLKLPIGISFFTFQAISYLVDVARGDSEVQRNPLLVGLYIAFFPQLVAGPIIRYRTIAAAFAKRQESFQDFTIGIERFVIGLCKKVLIANTLAIVADRAFAMRPEWLSASYAWLGALAYSLQIYFDFSGYSDMALGLGRIFGFHFEENFNLPYMSASISEFWRRWHISLGTWFRDYVYFPLGGSRVETSRRLVFNLAVVWLLTGLWHGAEWTFILWGLYFLVFLIIEKLSGMDTTSQLGWQLPRRLYTLTVVICGWVLFRANDLTHALSYFRSMLGLNSIAHVDPLAILYLRENAVILVVALLLCGPVGKFISQQVTRYKRLTLLLQPVSLVLLFLMAVSCIVKNTYNPFIYFNF